MSLNNIQNDVVKFMRKAEQAVPLRPIMPSVEVRKLRLSLIAEELSELAEAYGMQASLGFNGEFIFTEVRDADACEIDAYDAVIDLLVVVVGTAVANGTLIKPGWDEVHASNMSKFIDGHKRADGKWINKGPSTFIPKLGPILDLLRQYDSATYVEKGEA